MRKNSIKNTRINGEVQKELSTIEYGVNMSKLIDDVARRDASLGKTEEE